MRVGFTGHQNLPMQSVAFIDNAIRADLEREAGNFTGVSSLADGADQLFAAAVLALGGSLEVIVPSAGYETTFSANALYRYRDLIRKAETVRQLDFENPTEEAFFVAGKQVVDDSDRVLAVWDGKEAGGLGGTADIVRYARARGVSVTVIWPEGFSR